MKKKTWKDIDINGNRKQNASNSMNSKYHSSTNTIEFKKGKTFRVYGVKGSAEFNYNSICSVISCWETSNQRNEKTII